MGTDAVKHSDSKKYFDKDPVVTRKSAAAYAQDATDLRREGFKGSSSTGLIPVPGQEISASGNLALVLEIDQTGSMVSVPGLIFSRIANLYVEANASLQGLSLKDLQEQKITAENKLEMALIAVGDAKGDQYPIQVVDFSKGEDLVKMVNRIHPEGAGGGNAKESYDLATYFMLNHCKTPNCPKPVLIIVGDEGFYDKVSRGEVSKYFGDSLPEEPDTKKLMKELAERFDTYIVRPEECYDASTYAKIREQWREVLGRERVMKLDNPERLVDCIVGICGYAAENYKESLAMLERRQIDPDKPAEGLNKVEQVLTTMKSLLGEDAVAAEIERLREKYKSAVVGRLKR